MAAPAPNPRRVSFAVHARVHTVERFGEEAFKPTAQQEVKRLLELAGQPVTTRDLVQRQLLETALSLENEDPFLAEVTVANTRTNRMSPPESEISDSSSECDSEDSEREV